MPSPLGFFADVVRTGTVAGVDWTFAPEDVRACFGAEPAENRNEPWLWHDYGLVEFFWERTAVGRSWRGTHFSVQVHRLGDSIGYEIPQLVAVDDRAPGRVAFDALRDELSAQSVSLVEAPWRDDDLRAYWQPRSTVLMLVVADDPSSVSHASAVPPGHVYAITAPYRSDWFQHVVPAENEVRQ